MARPVERVDCLVVGAGVIGMAVARALALKGREVCVSNNKNHLLSNQIQKQPRGVTRRPKTSGSMIIARSLFSQRLSLRAREGPKEAWACGAAYCLC